MWSPVLLSVDKMTIKFRFVGENLELCDQMTGAIISYPIPAEDHDRKRFTDLAVEIVAQNVTDLGSQLEQSHHQLSQADR